MIKTLHIPFTCAIAISGGFFAALSFINPHDGTISLSQLILQLSGSRAEFVLEPTLIELLAFFLRILPMLSTSVVIGLELYRHFCTASVYVFSRYPKRFQWFVSEALKMLLVSLLFEFVYVLSAIGLTVERYQVLFERSGMVFLALHLIIYSIWLYCGALSIFILATYMGSDSGCIVVVGLQTFMIGMLRLADSEYGIWTVRFNPIARLVLGWHSSNVNFISEIVGDHINEISFGISFSTTIPIFLIVAIVITIAIGKNIELRDLFGYDTETGGI